MADNNATTIVRWSYKDPDDTGGTVDTAGDGIGGDGDATILLELADEYDIIGYCEAARRLIKAHISGDITPRATITSGTISGGREVVDNYSETITFRRSDSYNLRRNLSEITFSWEGQVFNMEGEAVTPPSVSYADGIITLSFKIAYGNLKVIGRETYQEYICEIPEDAIAVFAWDGGVADIEVPLPEMDCSTEVDPDDADYICWKRTFYVDPCSGEITSQTRGRMSCDEVTHASCSERSDSD